MNGKPGTITADSKSNPQAATRRGENADHDLFHILLITASGSSYLHIKSALNDSMYDVNLERERDAAKRRIVMSNIHLVIIDLERSTRSGIKLCSGIRLLSTVPILLLTASSRVDETVLALQSGADHVVHRSVTQRELAAHIFALVRRIYLFGQSGYVQAVSHGDIVLDRVLRVVKIGGRTSSLTDTESRLLACLLVQPNQVVAKESLLANVWGHGNDTTSNVVELTVARLRKKIELDPGKPQRLLTARGLGYLLQTTIPLHVLTTTTKSSDKTRRRSKALLPFRLRIVGDK